MSLHSQFRTVLQTLAYSQVNNSIEFNNYFDTWKLIQVTEPMKTKLGIAFDKDEISIAKPEIKRGVDSLGKPKETVAVWSFKNQKIALVPSQYITVLEGEFNLNNIP